mgnify:CR=1 FL=1
MERKGGSPISGLTGFPDTPRRHPWRGRGKSGQKGETNLDGRKCQFLPFLYHFILLLARKRNGVILLKGFGILAYPPEGEDFLRKIDLENQPNARYNKKFPKTQSIESFVPP